MMIIRQNRYTVKEKYVAQNQEQISRVVEELRALGRLDISYSVFVEDNGKTFLHLLFCANDEAEQVFFRLPSQQAFQAGLAASHLEVPPTMTTLGLVGATSDLLRAQSTGKGRRLYERQQVLIDENEEEEE